MRLPNFAPKLPSWLLFGMLLPLRAWPACGLNFCPRSQIRENATEVGLSFRQAEFDLEGSEGSFSEIMAEAEYTWAGRWAIGLMFPWIALDLPGAGKNGSGNPLLLTEWRFQPPLGSRAALGLQLEFPLGNDQDGLAGPHYILIPYATWSQAWDLFFLDASGGASLALNEAHQHHHIPLYVHPHEEKEILYRLACGLSLWRGRSHPEISLGGQYVVSERRMYGDADHYLALGLGFPVTLGRYTLAPNAELPLTSPGRLDWSAGLSTRAAF